MRSGKTTLLSILSGLLAPTSGDAQLFGRSIRRDLTWIRTQLGVCPQHDILFPHLSAYEHLWLCASLRGVPRSAIDRDAERLFTAVGLKPADLLKMADTLSGGQKRKLAIAIAFVGDTRLVLLDEPTSGMDPHSRRELWQFLRREQRNRCIVLTTHSFDEAELLGDRVLVLSRGRARAAGTVAQLKRRFGLGYHLKVKLLPPHDTAALDALVEREAAAVDSQPPPARFDAKLPPDGDARPVTYVFALDRTAALARVLEQLEAQRDALRIESYSVYQTSLEEIFTRLAAEEEHVDDEIEEAAGLAVDPEILLEHEDTRVQ